MWDTNMEETDADGEWSDEDFAGVSARTGMGDKEDNLLNSMTRPKSPHTAHPLSSSTDAVSLILNRIDAELLAMKDQDSKTTSNLSLLEKSRGNPTRPSPASRTASMFGKHLTVIHSQPNSDSLASNLRTPDVSDSNKRQRMYGSTEEYKTPNTDEDREVKSSPDVPCDLDPYTAQEIDTKFKEIMRKKKVAPDLPGHPDNRTTPTITRTTSWGFNRPSVTMLSTGYGTDNDSVRTEDFEAKFMGMMVQPSTSDRKASAPRDSAGYPGIKLNQSGSIVDSTSEPHSMASHMDSLQRRRTVDNIRGEVPRAPLQRRNSQLFSWDDVFWKQNSKKGTQSVISTASTFEEVESLCFSKSSLDSIETSQRPVGGGRPGGPWSSSLSSRKLGSRQSSTTSTSTSRSSGFQFDDLGPDISPGRRQSITDTLIESMEFLNSNNNLDLADKFYLENIFRRVLDWDNGMSDSPAGLSSATDANYWRDKHSPGSNQRNMGSSIPQYLLQENLEKSHPANKMNSKQKIQHELSQTGRNPNLKKRRQRDLILPDEDEAGNDVNRNEAQSIIGVMNESRCPAYHLTSDTKGSSKVLSPGSISNPLLSSFGMRNGLFMEPAQPTRRMNVPRVRQTGAFLQHGGSEGSTTSDDPYTFNQPYTTSHAERVLMGLGFGASEGFLPDRFLKDWYNKIAMSQLTTQAERKDKNSLDNSDETVGARDGTQPNPSELNLDTSQRHPHQAQREGSHRSAFPESSLMLPPKSDNNTHMANASDNQSSRPNLSSATATQREVKMRHFASSRQNSLPLYPEALSQDEERRSRSPGLDSFDKEASLQKFISDVLSNSWRNSHSKYSQSDSLNSSSNRHSSSQQIPFQQHPTYRKQNNRHNQGVSSQKQTKQNKEPERETSSVQRQNSLTWKLQSSPTVQYISKYDDKYSNSSDAAYPFNVSDVNNVPSSWQQWSDNKPPLSVQGDRDISLSNVANPSRQGTESNNKNDLSKSQSILDIAQGKPNKTHTIQSKDSIEVADIMQPQFTSGQGLSGASQGTIDIDKSQGSTRNPNLKHIEPAMVSIVLEDVDQDQDDASMEPPSLASEGRHLSISSSRRSSYSLSPIPQSPVTVIEVGLDNQQDSMDTEGTCSSKDTDDDTCGNPPTGSSGVDEASQQKRDREEAGSSIPSFYKRTKSTRPSSPIHCHPSVVRTSADSIDAPSSRRLSLDVPLIPELRQMIDRHKVPKINQSKDSLDGQPHDREKIRTSLSEDVLVSNGHELGKDILHSVRDGPRSSLDSSMRSARRRHRRNNYNTKLSESIDNKESIYNGDTEALSLPGKCQFELMVLDSRHSHRRTKPSPSSHNECHNNLQKSSVYEMVHDTDNCCSDVNSNRDYSVRASMKEESDPGSTKSAFRYTGQLSAENNAGPFNRHLSDTAIDDVANKMEVSAKPHLINSVVNNSAFRPSHSEVYQSAHTVVFGNNNGISSPPLTFVDHNSSVSTPSSGHRKKDSVISISRAVQVDESLFPYTLHNDQTNGSCLTSSQYFYARDTGAQCDLTSWIQEAKSAHCFDKCTQTGIPRYEISCQTTEAFYYISGNRQVLHSRDQTRTKAVNTVVCLIGQDHDNMFNVSEYVLPVDGLTDFRFVDETLQLIEAELVSIRQRERQRFNFDTQLLSRNEPDIRLRFAPSTWQDATTLTDAATEIYNGLRKAEQNRSIEISSPAHEKVNMSKVSIVNSPTQAHDYCQQRLDSVRPSSDIKRRHFERSDSSQIRLKSDSIYISNGNECNIYNRQLANDLLDGYGSGDSPFITSVQGSGDGMDSVTHNTITNKEMAKPPAVVGAFADDHLSSKVNILELHQRSHQVTHAIRQSDLRIYGALGGAVSDLDQTLLAGSSTLGIKKTDSCYGQHSLASREIVIDLQNQTCEQYQERNDPNHQYENSSPHDPCSKDDNKSICDSSPASIPGSSAASVDFRSSHTICPVDPLTETSDSLELRREAHFQEKELDLKEPSKSSSAFDVESTEGTISNLDRHFQSCECDMTNCSKHDSSTVSSTINSNQQNQTQRNMMVTSQEQQIDQTNLAENCLQTDNVKHVTKQYNISSMNMFYNRTKEEIDKKQPPTKIIATLERSTNTGIPEIVITPATSLQIGFLDVPGSPEHLFQKARLPSPTESSQCSTSSSGTEISRSVSDTLNNTLKLRKQKDARQISTKNPSHNFVGGFAVDSANVIRHNFAESLANFDVLVSDIDTKKNSSCLEEQARHNLSDISMCSIVSNSALDDVRLTTDEGIYESSSMKRGIDLSGPALRTFDALIPCSDVLEHNVLTFIDISQRSPSLGGSIASTSFQRSVDVYSNRSVAGSDSLPNDEDLNMLIDESRRLRLSSSSSYSDLEMDMADNLSKQSFLSSNSQRIDGNMVLLSVYDNDGDDLAQVSDFGDMSDNGYQTKAQNVEDNACPFLRANVEPVEDNAGPSFRGNIEPVEDNAGPFFRGNVEPVKDNAGPSSRGNVEPVEDKVGPSFRANVEPVKDNAGPSFRANVESVKDNIGPSFRARAEPDPNELCDISRDFNSYLRGRPYEDVHCDVKMDENLDSDIEYHLTESRTQTQSGSRQGSHNNLDMVQSVIRWRNKCSAHFSLSIEEPSESVRPSGSTRVLKQDSNHQPIPEDTSAAQDSADNSPGLDLSRKNLSEDLTEESSDYPVDKSTYCRSIPTPDVPDSRRSLENRFELREENLVEESNTCLINPSTDDSLNSIPPWDIDNACSDSLHILQDLGVSAEDGASNYTGNFETTQDSSKERNIALKLDTYFNHNSSALCDTDPVLCAGFSNRNIEGENYQKSSSEDWVKLTNEVNLLALFQNSDICDFEVSQYFQQDSGESASGIHSLSEISEEESGNEHSTSEGSNTIWQLRNRFADAENSVGDVLECRQDSVSDAYNLPALSYSDTFTRNIFADISMKPTSNVEIFIQSPSDNGSIALNDSFVEDEGTSIGTSHTSSTDLVSSEISLQFQPITDNCQHTPSSIDSHLGSYFQESCSKATTNISVSIEDERETYTNIGEPDPSKEDISKPLVWSVQKETNLIFPYETLRFERKSDAFGNVTSKSTYSHTTRVTHYNSNTVSSSAVTFKNMSSRDDVKKHVSMATITVRDYRKCKEGDGPPLEIRTNFSTDVKHKQVLSNSSSTGNNIQGVRTLLNAALNHNYQNNGNDVVRNDRQIHENNYESSDIVETAYVQVKRNDTNNDTGIGRPGQIDNDTGIGYPCQIDNDTGIDYMSDNIEQISNVDGFVKMSYNTDQGKNNVNRCEVDGDGRSEVDGDGRNEVDGDGRSEVDGDGSSEIDGDGRREVDCDGRSEVDGDGRSEVDGDGRSEVDGDGRSEVDGDGRSEVDGDGRSEVDGDWRGELNYDTCQINNVNDSQENNDTGRQVNNDMGSQANNDTGRQANNDTGSQANNFTRRQVKADVRTEITADIIGQITDDTESSLCSLHNMTDNKFQPDLSLDSKQYDNTTNISTVRGTRDDINNQIKYDTDADSSSGSHSPVSSDSGIRGETASTIKSDLLSGYVKEKVRAMFFKDSRKERITLNENAIPCGTGSSLGWDTDSQGNYDTGSLPSSDIICPSPSDKPDGYLKEKVREMLLTCAEKQGHTINQCTLPCGIEKYLTVDTVRGNNGVVTDDTEYIINGDITDVLNCDTDCQINGDIIGECMDDTKRQFDSDILNVTNRDICTISDESIDSDTEWHRGEGSNNEINTDQWYQIDSSSPREGLKQTVREMFLLDRRDADYDISRKASYNFTQKDDEVEAIDSEVFNEDQEHAHLQNPSFGNSHTNSVIENNPAGYLKIDEGTLIGVDSTDGINTLGCEEIADANTRLTIAYFESPRRRLGQVTTEYPLGSDEMSTIVISLALDDDGDEDNDDVKHEKQDEELWSDDDCNTDSTQFWI